MKLGFTLLYTRDVAAKLAFYEKAFGCKRIHVSPGGEYGQLEGDIPLGFVKEDFAKHVVDFAPNRADRAPAGIEIGFVVDDVAKAFDRAVKAGCAPVEQPNVKPWGQTVSLVRDDDGVLVEISTAWSF
jgi:lactoylglutathione lyase